MQLPGENIDGDPMHKEKSKNVSSPAFSTINHSKRRIGSEINQLKDRASKFLGCFWKPLWKMNGSHLESSCIRKVQQTRDRVFLKWERLKWGKNMKLGRTGRQI